MKVDVQASGFGAVELGSASAEVVGFLQVFNIRRSGVRIRFVLSPAA